jgi:hypothetical protein
MIRCEKCGQEHILGHLGSHFLNLQGRMVWVCYRCLFKIAEDSE